MAIFVTSKRQTRDREVPVDSETIGGCGCLLAIFVVVVDGRPSQKSSWVELGCLY